MNNDKLVLQIIDVYLQAISFVQEEINALTEKKPWKLKDLVSQGSTMMNQFYDVREIILNDPSILEKCNPEHKSTVMDLCTLLQAKLKKKMKLLEDAMFVNELLVNHIKQAIHRTTNNHCYNMQTKNFHAPVALNEEM